jgi:hypothetical protein
MVKAWLNEALQKFCGRDITSSASVRQRLLIQSREHRRFSNHSLTLFLLIGLGLLALVSYRQPRSLRFTTCSSGVQDSKKSEFEHFTMQMPDVPVNVPVDDPNADTEW